MRRLNTAKFLSGSQTAIRFDIGLSVLAARCQIPLPFFLCREALRHFFSVGFCHRCETHTKSLSGNSQVGNRDIQLLAPKFLRQLSNELRRFIGRITVLRNSRKFDWRRVWIPDRFDIGFDRLHVHFLNASFVFAQHQQSKNSTCFDDCFRMVTVRPNRNDDAPMSARLMRMLFVRIFRPAIFDNGSRCGYGR